MELNIFVYNEEPNINIENSFYISLLFIKKQVKLINDVTPGELSLTVSLNPCKLKNIYI